MDRNYVSDYALCPQPKEQNNSVNIVDSHLLY